MICECERPRHVCMLEYLGKIHPVLAVRVHSCECEEVYTRKTGYTSSNIWRDTTITRTGKWHASRNRQKEIETRAHNLANQNRTNK